MALTKTLLEDGHSVVGIDNFLKDFLIDRVGSKKILQTSIYHMACFEKFKFHQFNIANKRYLDVAISNYKPDIIVNLSQIPSAPYSMIGYNETMETIDNNIKGTISLMYSVAEHCPDAHIVQLATMGEYPSNSGVEIPEGFFKFKYKGKESNLMPFPRMGCSHYHISKISMSKHTELLVKCFNLRVSEIMQGIIYGVTLSNGFYTHFHIDECFGTVLNRFVAQAIIGEPLTIYGDGSQIRAFLSLADAMQCYKLIMNKIPEPGQYECYNQFDESYKIKEVANKVIKIAKEFDISATVKDYTNPRIEPKQENYMPINEKLKALGYKREEMMDDTLRDMFKFLIPKKRDLSELKDVLLPSIDWRKPNNEKKRCVRNN